MPQIEKDYIQTGKIMYVFKDLPLEAIHPQAFKAAEAGHCAGDQGKFWQMHDTLFANMKALRPEDLMKYAKTEGLNMPIFQQCLDSGKYAEDIRSDMAEARNAGITGTPAFLLGFVEPDGKVKAVKKVVGAQPYAAFKDAIEGIITQKK